MKILLLELSLMGLMMAISAQSLADDSNKNTDAEVLALVNAAAAQETTPQKQIKAEEEAPLFKAVKAEKKSKAEGGIWLWLRMIGSLALVVVLFIGGMYAFKQMPAGKNIVGRGKMIQVLSQHHMGAKKSLAVIRVAGETVLVGITDNNISILKSLSLLDEDIPTAKSQKFSQTLKQKINPEEEFSMRGLKDAVGERLRNMKELG